MTSAGVSGFASARTVGSDGVSGGVRRRPRGPEPTTALTKPLAKRRSRVLAFPSAVGALRSFPCIALSSSLVRDTSTA